jgi:hypothetical protein
VWAGPHRQWTLQIYTTTHSMFSRFLIFSFQRCSLLDPTHTHTHTVVHRHTHNTHTRGVARAHTHGAEKDKNWLPLGPRGGQKCVSGTLWRPKIAVALGKSAHSRERLPPLRKKRDQRLGLKIAGDALRPKLHCSASSSSSSSSRRCPHRADGGPDPPAAPPARPVHRSKNNEPKSRRLS